ncbi:MAG: hypothetical protein KF856_09795 [Cyclobacteriaceae bacterium]|nr:hypothetical protein [Cyclobacteriaceae bacterium]
MVVDIKTLNAVLGIFSKLREGFIYLKGTNLFLKDTSISDIVERYFGFEQLPNSKIKFNGRLSWYAYNTNFLAYSPFITRGTKEQQKLIPVINPNTGKPMAKFSLNTTFQRLSVPSIKLNEIQLSDGTFAKIVWLYPETTKGLILEPLKGGQEDLSNPLTVFKLSENDRPIPCLVASQKNINDHLNRSVEIIGKITTAPLSIMEKLLSSLDPFMTNVYGNFYRPFSTNEGILAIDLRGNEDSIVNKEEKTLPFQISYTVQGKIEFHDSSKDLRQQVNNIANDSIPDRQGMGKLSQFGIGDHPVKSLLTIGDITWQVNDSISCYAMSLEVETGDIRLFQEKITKMANNWQGWQKKTRNDIKRKTGHDVKILPILCSNSDQAKLFHPAGMQISKEIESRLFNENPAIRESIDWLKISTGRI